MLTNSAWQRRVALGVYIVPAWLLASCAEPEFEQTTQVNQVQCTNYGVEPGTAQFFSCMTGQDLGEQYFHPDVYPSQTYFY